MDANQTAVQRIINNTILANGRGVVLNNPASSAENNIIANNTGDGLVGNDKGAMARYNDVWGNGLNYIGIQPGMVGISADPLFNDAPNADYRLQYNSPARDAGNPDPSYNDLDGTRNDMGRYGGPYSISPCTLEGDMDSNYIVNKADATLAAVHWRQRTGDVGWEARFDINNDGVINVLDVLEIASRVGQTCP